MKHLIILITILTTLQFQLKTLASETANFTSKTDVKVGYIGIFDEKTIDNPSDNVFTIELSNRPVLTDEIWLSYELYGVSNHNSVSRSINNQMSVGGQLVTTGSNEWIAQKEQINPQWLKQGENIVRFSIPPDAKYNYKIRNLNIAVKNLGDEKRAIITNLTNEQAFVNNSTYIKGFVKGKDAATAKIYINDKSIESYHTEFEAAVHLTNTNKKQAVVLKAVFEDGEIIEKEVILTNFVKAAIANEIAEPFSSHLSTQFIPGRLFQSNLDEVELAIESDGLNNNTNISISALRNVDMPSLDAGMVNVTKNEAGYRFLPHGTQFNNAATLSLAFDEQKIPAGYTAKNIKTYFFDEESKHWKALPTDTVELELGMIVSKTTHFTDMINAVIQVPESPETGAHTPTSIKDIKAADPSANINVIQPPSANNMGNANLGYPIVVPPGRQGMQPQLGIQYNSGGGNGWLGLGWDLSIPQISIDTRWGVPRYDGTKETETYMLNGQQLTPVAHRGELIDRNTTGTKQFYPRVEGAFNKIIRHGTNPNNYWWEVTDKSGTVYSYGGTASGGIDEGAVLRTGGATANNNIANWALVEVRDLNDNFVKYHCTRQQDVGVVGGSVPGYNTYVNKITYTGNGTTEGKYEVVFLRDRDKNEAKRIDVNIDARLGFKKVTADLLREVKVNYNNQANIKESVRSYELTYKTGAFEKTLLDKITEFDAEGSFFNEHTFEYYDDVDAANGYSPLSDIEEPWNTQNDNVSGKLTIGNLLNVLNINNASALGSSISNGWGLGFALTFGVGAKVWSKAKSAGLNLGFDFSNNKGLLSLVDINGDNLPDKIFKEENNGVSTLYFRPNNGSNTFGSKVQINGIREFSKGKSNTSKWGFEAHFGLSASYTRSKTKSFNSIYFSDVNGDQLTDIVNEGIVYFNRLVNGVPTFQASSVGTDCVVCEDGNVDVEVIQDPEDEIFNPLHDAVRVWIAPYDGTVTIDAPVTLEPELVIGPGTPLPSTTDGVDVTIQHNATEIWTQNIPAGELTTYTQNNLTAAVLKGDRIYFRVQSINDGNKDAVHWDQTITYDFNTCPCSFALTDYNVTCNNDGTYNVDLDIVLNNPTSNNFNILVDGVLYGNFADANNDNLESVTLSNIPTSTNGRLEIEIIATNSRSCRNTFYLNVTELELINSLVVCGKGNTYDLILDVALNGNAFGTFYIYIDGVEYGPYQDSFPLGVEQVEINTLVHTIPYVHVTVSSNNQNLGCADISTIDLTQCFDCAIEKQSLSISCFNSQQYNTTLDFVGYNIGSQLNLIVEDANGVEVINENHNTSPTEITFGPLTAGFQNKYYYTLSDVNDSNCFLSDSVWVSSCANKTVEEQIYLKTSNEDTYLASFRGKQANNSFVIKWESSCISSQKAFQIQKSLDGIKYETIHTQECIVNKNEYEFTDENFDTAKAIYKLTLISDDNQMNKLGLLIAEKHKSYAKKDDTVSRLNAKKSTFNCADVDANNVPIYQFNATDDFVLSSVKPVSFPFNGTVQIGGTVTKDFTSDDVEVLIVRNNINIASYIMPYNSTASQLTNQTITVEEGDILSFKLRANTTVDWTALDWTPTVVYTALDPAVDVHPSFDMSTIDLKPAVEHTVFNKVLQPALRWEAPQTGTYTITPTINTNLGYVFTVKKPLELVEKRINSNAPITVNLQANDIVYFDYHILNEVYESDFPNIVRVDVSFNNNAATQEYASLYSLTKNYLFGINDPLQTDQSAIDMKLFGNLYRQWGQFAYNGNNASAAIDEGEINAFLQNILTITEADVELEIDEDDIGCDPDVDDVEDCIAEMDNLINNWAGNAFIGPVVMMMTPDLEKDLYAGFSPNVYVKADTMRSSRFGLTNLIDNPVTTIPGVPASADGKGAKAIKTLRISKNNSISLGVGPGSFSYSGGNSQQIYDYIDMNGDRHPDILSDPNNNVDLKIQYTLPTGGLETSSSTVNIDDIQRSNHRQIGLGLAGGSSPSEDQTSDEKTRGEQSSDSEKKADASVGFSFDIGTNKDKVQYDNMDINGDGLPDRVYKNGDVQLNLGYEFAPIENWGFNVINDGSTTSEGIGGTLGINIDKKSIVAGIGASFSQNKIIDRLIDINGDGLLDMIDDIDDEDDTPDYVEDINDETDPTTSTCNSETTFSYCTLPATYIAFTIPNICGLDAQTQQIVTIDSSFPEDFISAYNNNVTFQPGTSTPNGIHTVSVLLTDDVNNSLVNVTINVNVTNNCDDNAETCENINGNFETYRGPTQAGNAWINDNLTNWCVSHGSPSLGNGFDPSTVGIWMWANTTNRGEGIFTDFNFQLGRSYTIEYSVYLYQNTNAQFLVELANNIDCTESQTSAIPTITSKQNVSTHTFAEEGEWVIVTETFTANGNYEHLWLYPRLNIAGDQVEVVVDNICITENISDAKTANSSSASKKEDQANSEKSAKKMDDLGVRLNTGNGFSNQVISWSGAEDINKGNSAGESASFGATGGFTFFGIFKICLNGTGHGSKGISREKLSIRDVDGDGYPDYVYTNPNTESDASLTVKRSTIGKTNLLKQVSRPLGADFTMNYNRIGNSYAMPNDVWALASVETFDGFAGDGADNMRNTFEYDDGFYHRCEREFYGFKNVKTHQHNTENNNAKYRTVEQNFINNTTANFTNLDDIYFLKGMLDTEVVQDAAGNKYTETVNSFALNAANEPGSVFPTVTLTRSNFYEGGSTAEKYTTAAYMYDEYGNVTNYTHTGDNLAPISSTIQYHELLGNYIVGTPSSIVVTDDNSTTLRQRETNIDGIGRVTQIRQYLVDGTIAQHDMTYNNVGNLTKITRPPNATGQRMSFNYTYDPAVQTYVTGVSDAYGYSSNSTYDYRFGQMLTSTDINGNIISYTVDDAGRIDEIRGPFEQTTTKPTIKFEYFPDANIPYATTQHYDPAHPTNDLETVTFMDGLMRPVQVKKDASIFNASGQPDLEQMIVSGRVIYDAYGRTVESFYPINEVIGNATTFNTGVDTENPTQTTYDILDRPLSITLPDASTISNQYGFGNDRDGVKQFETSILDANNVWKKQFTNSRGLTTATLEQLSQTQAGQLWTSYAYNSINELLSVTDAMNDAISYQYDWFGRRLQMDHPDGGITFFNYDLTGNVISKTTANLSATNESIDYTYDFERLTNITYPQNTQNNVEYTYGGPTAVDNRRGRIMLQKDATGEQRFAYNDLGALIYNKRDVNVDGSIISMTTNWEYDTWNRLTQLTYPDGEALTYNYNLGGKLQSMSSTLGNSTYNYVQQLGYDKFEQNVYVKYGNNTETTYTYDAQRRWLDKINAKTAGGMEFMKNDYAYDNVGNISQITNSAAAQTNIGGPASYTFTYDDMYRLTNATGSFTGADAVANTYNLDMAYNNAHAITSKNQVHTKGGATVDATSYNFEYAYNGAQPHAPTNLTSNDGADDDRQYTYDANGNQLSYSASGCDFRAYSWDEENRLMLVTDDDEEHFYTYDANGDRIIKNTQDLVAALNPPASGTLAALQNYTVYMNPYVVVRNGEVTKHFYTEGRRICSKLSGDYDVANGTINEAANALTYYFHPDHLGNSSYISDGSGGISQHIEYFPFGEVFIEEQNNTYNTPYLFNGKELDDKTGLYYYGARYYDPVLSNWLSVDPLAHKMPKWSPYNYTFNNPLGYTDPDGRNPVRVGKMFIKIGWKTYRKMKKAGNFNRKNFINELKKSGLDEVMDLAGDLYTIVAPESTFWDRTKATFDVMTGFETNNKGDKAVKELYEKLNTKKSSRAARRETMRDEGIPTSQQPKSQSKNQSGREYEYEVPKEGGGTQSKSVQQQTMDRSHDEPHWEGGRVKTDDAGQVRYNDYNRPKLSNDKSKVNYNDGP